MVHSTFHLLILLSLICELVVEFVETILCHESVFNEQC